MFTGLLNRTVVMKNEKPRFLITVLAMLAVTGVVVAQCMNRSGYAHDANAVCMDCPQWTAQNTGASCTTHIYNANVTINCFKKRNPAIVINYGGYPDQGCVEANASVQIRSGTCTGGGCIGGTVGPWTSAGWMCLWSYTQCFVGG